MKDKSIFVCENCGNEYLRWQGKCDACGGWNTLKEITTTVTPSRGGSLFSVKPLKLAEIKDKDFKRFASKIEEWDRVLGGGIVKGSIILLGGDPGIGKSTLLMQLADCFTKTLYISGEESLPQLKLRAKRLDTNTKTDFLAETNLESILQAIETNQPEITIIDSIQALYDPTFPSTAGSIVQVRECALRLQNLCKQKGLSVILVGHVTKEGSVAGPRTLEHLVDALLYLEGEKFIGTRILRAVKNRFGTTDEVGIFQMSQNGLKEVKNPSELFLEKHKEAVSGSIVTVTLQGNRPLLLEIQALSNPTLFGLPRRVSSGFDFNRLQLILAVLQKRAGINLSGQDVYINVVGGLHIEEPAIDLPIALAVVSAFKNKPIAQRTVVFGEIGLSGEVRDVSLKDKRIKEAKRLGFQNIIETRNIVEALKKIDLA